MIRMDKGERVYESSPIMKWLVTSTAKSKSDNYLRWLASAGIEGVPILPSDSTLALADALLLTGGGDVDPKRYHAVPASETDGVDADRDEMECRLIERFIKAGKPVFGVCRGIQILNVARGGNLIQHVPSVLNKIEQHAQVDGKDAVHSVSFTKGSTLAEALGEVLTVNSAHHQAVDPKVLGRGLHIIAVSGQGIVEAVEGVDLGAPVLAVQWHPERLEPRTCAAAAELLNLMKQLAAE
jgi:putative glutamine amidotransferase